jgi:primosomal replication protein N
VTLSREVANRIELCGHLLDTPSLRVTPAGTSVLSLVVDCGAKAGELRMPVVIAGESARALAHRLSTGSMVRARGSLRPVPSRQRTAGAAPVVEVIADEITLAQAGK